MSASSEQATYSPTNVLKPVSEGLWIVDSGPLVPLGFPLPTRMTVVRLRDGKVWLHSPSTYDRDLRQQIERIGSIRHLIAPNIAHWSFIQTWKTHCPDARTYAAPGLQQRRQVRKAGLRFDETLSGEVPKKWADDLQHIEIRGGAGFHEVVFFHKATRTLILTDLVQNLEARKLPRLVRPFASLLGVLAPNGRAPLYLRGVVLLNRKAASKAAKTLIALGPERVIFSHGRWFESEGTTHLLRCLDWLL